MFTATAVALPQKKRMKARRLVVVDIENVVGGAVHEAEAVAWAKAQVEAFVEPSAGDHVVIGTSHVGLLVTGCTWTGVRYVVGSGPDGADLALMEVLDENVADRFGGVVVVSGDGIFTEQVAALAHIGVQVMVLAHPDGLAARLRLAAGDVQYLPARYSPQFGDAA